MSTLSRAIEYRGVDNAITRPWSSALISRAEELGTPIGDLPPAKKIALTEYAFECI